MGTTGTKSDETCQKHTLMGMTGTKPGETFQIQGFMVLIGNKFNETVPKTRPNGDKGNKSADFVPQEN